MRAYNKSPEICCNGRAACPDFPKHESPFANEVFYQHGVDDRYIAWRIRNGTGAGVGDCAVVSSARTLVRGELSLFHRDVSSDVGLGGEAASEVLSGFRVSVDAVIRPTG